MKYAIVGYLSPLAQPFLKYLNRTRDEHEYRFFEMDKFLPIVELRGQEYRPEVLEEESLSEIDADLFVFFPKNNTQNLMLKAEEYGKHVLDLSSVFAAENTIPLIVPGVNPGKYKNASLVSVADPYLFVLSPLLELMENRFHIKRAQMTVHTPEPVQLITDGYTDREMDLINQCQKVLDDKQTRITFSLNENLRCTKTRFNLNIEFIRPLNTETLKKQVQGLPHFTYSQEEALEDPGLACIVRTRRDLSVDSGLHLCVEVGDLSEFYARGIYALLNETVTQE